VHYIQHSSRLPVMRYGLRRPHLRPLLLLRATAWDAYSLPPMAERRVGAHAPVRARLGGGSRDDEGRAHRRSRPLRQGPSAVRAPGASRQGRARPRLLGDPDAADLGRRIVEVAACSLGSSTTGSERRSKVHRWREVPLCQLAPPVVRGEREKAASSSSAAGRVEWPAATSEAARRRAPMPRAGAGDLDSIVRVVERVGARGGARDLTLL
jgi:hypothetical protein